MSFRPSTAAPLPPSSARRTARPAHATIALLLLAPALASTPLLGSTTLLGSTPLLAQAVAPAAGQTSTAGTVRGAIADPDGAAIPGAVITFTPASGSATTVNSGSDGNYTVRNLVPGTYSVTVTMQGFATFTRPALKVSAATPLTLNAKLAIQTADTTINVTTTTNNAVSVDPDNNASSTILTGKDLDALSDDPDELSSELSALAGPAAGPNGGQIYIDGFTGGQLPPKSSIREIRINQNPFSAQFDRAGFGRVEVFTKPGTDKFHGSANLQGQDKSFNSGSPTLGNSLQPGYHTILFQGSVTGPVSKTSSFSLGGSYRTIQDNAVVNPPAVYATSQNSGTICAPGAPGCQIFAALPVVYNGVTIAPGGNPYISAQPTPQIRWDISPRVDIALGEKNTLITRFQYERNSNQFGGIGANSLLSTGSNSVSDEAEIQMTDTQILSAKVINETRFEYQRGTSTSTPLSTAPSINVNGAFNAGGSGGQTSNDIQTHIEVQNYTSIALSKNFIRFGGRLRTTGETNTTTAGTNGSFTYASIGDYLNNSPCGSGPKTPACTGILTQFSITNITNPTISARATDVGLYAETDWKVRPNITFSYGLRFETQNFIHDHADFAPRASVAYGLNKKTVLRAGAGLFYDRFNLGNEFNVYRNNGINQQRSILSAVPASAANPLGIPIAAGCNPNAVNLSAACPAAASGRFTTNNISSNLRAPYQLQLNVGVDEQLFKGATVSVNYQHVHGVHQYNSDVANYNTLSASTPIQYQYQSEGTFNQNQLVTNMNYRAGRASLFGYYVINYAKADTSGAGYFGTNPYNLKADYGRASFDTRQRLFLGGSLTLPHLINLSPLMVATSGSPYNITTGTDQNGDTIFNDRAVFAPAGTMPLANGYVKTINGCGTFASQNTPGSGAIVPINYCTGPANFTFNLRATKTIGFGESTRPKAASGGDQGPGPGGPGGDRRGGGGGDRGGRGGMFGGGGGSSSGKRYNLSLGVQVSNLFNVVDRGTPIGTLSSPEFGTSTQLSGNIFTTNSAIRRIYLQSSFNF